VRVKPPPRFTDEASFVDGRAGVGLLLSRVALGSTSLMEGPRPAHAGVVKVARMRAAFECFKAFDRRDADDDRGFAARRLPTPVLVLAGDKSTGGVPGVRAKIVADNVTAVMLDDTGRRVVEERPAEADAALEKFFRD
jgi:pimeloyl-ACP methyl ester carboxylesterase